MLHIKTTRPQLDNRPAVVLLIVISMLALFAIVALSFVFYAESEATAARYNREAGTSRSADVEPELLLSYFLGQLLYDTDDIYSAMRGHSLARTLYGANPFPAQNTTPFDGPGRLRYSVSAPAAATPAPNIHLLNHTYFQTDNFLRDPDHYGTRNTPADNKGDYLGGNNVPWTYPDLNSVCLAAVDGSGRVLSPSFHRESWLPKPNLVDPSATAWLSDNAWKKYLTLRPHTSYHTQFSSIDFDGFADVKNLDHSPGAVKSDGALSLYDSIWMDLGFPVMTAPDGTKYKALFAPLVVDLDGKVNLMVSGNIKNGGGYAGNHGFGRWEINPIKQASGTRARVLPETASTGFVSFIQNERYGSGNPANTSIAMPKPPYYSRFDFDGDATPGYSLPSVGSLNPFPTYPLTKWDSRQSIELVSPNHPAGYRYLNPGADKKLAASHMEALLRHYGKGSPAITSKLLGYLSSHVTGSTPEAVKARHLITLLSMDFDRQGMVPFYSSTTGSYTYDASKNMGQGVSTSFPTPATLKGAGGEFDSTSGRSLLNSVLDPRVKRLNLNRSLADYPIPDFTTDGLMASAAADMALEERRAFAEEIYKTLVKVTGAQDPTDMAFPFASIDPTSASFKAARWLAQLAVNIVDYMDNDDVMTRFPWINRVDGAPTVSETLYGTELPRLVINEAYVQYDNDAQDMEIINNMKAMYYRMNVWVELHNPMSTPATGETYPLNGCKAVLKGTTHIPYQLVLTKPDGKLRDSDNHTGKPDNAKIIETLDDWGANAVQQVVHPSNGWYSGTPAQNEGFFMVGPPTKDPNDATKSYFLPNRDPSLTCTYETRKMSPQWDKDEPRVEPTILLRRLANPYRPHDPSTNPYITVDYLDDVPFHNGIKFDKDGVDQIPGPITDFDSVGRKQPYAARKKEPQRPTTPSVTPPQPKHTFFWHNAKEDPGAHPDKTTQPQPMVMGLPNTLKRPFDWLVHMDRPLINPMELLYVSSFRPHELTQEFVEKDSPFDAHKHCAPWVDQKALIYRFLDMVATPDLMNCDIAAVKPQLVVGGRTPGKININTVWDPEVFQALCAALTVAQGGANGFDEVNVEDIFNELLAARSKTTVTGVSGTYRIPTAGDQPYLPLGVGYINNLDTQFPSGLGIADTILREHPSAMPKRSIFELAPGTPRHPYKQFELLTKIYNNMTTRSNCFAVWLTVGFFEIEPGTENARPPRLGKEIGRADNRHIRHRMFAIIDRTEMRVRLLATDKKTEAGLRFVGMDTSLPPKGIGQPTEVTRTDVDFDTMNGKKWKIDIGSVLVVSPDTPNEETVVVQSVDLSSTPPKIYFLPTRTHAAGASIIIRGNPGAWPNYNVRTDAAVVPHYTVIE